jgi:hypothetical protein
MIIVMTAASPARLAAPGTAAEPQVTGKLIREAK